MKYVTLPSDSRHPLPFYLAMEELVARKSGRDDSAYFFMWQVDPTVIAGRHQLIEQEVNLPYCRSHSIAVVRRKSGGGCVYADPGNIMMSYVGPSEADVAATFARYTDKVAQMLRSLGFDASVTGRNDITVDGRKVSGNAYYRHPSGCSIVHGTMLFNPVTRHLAAALTPSESKLRSKGVESVRSRVTWLSEHTDMDVNDFICRARHYMCGDEELQLTGEDTEEIERLSLPYLDDKWTFGHNPRATLSERRRIEGIGEFQVSVETGAGLIRDVSLTGDFMPLAPVDSLLDRLHGVSYDRPSVEAALATADVASTIAGLDNELLINLIF